MARVIRITAGSLQAEADLHDSATAAAIWEALPLTAPASTWGDEIYFRIPVRLEEERARETVGPGDLGYWPPGQAFCVFFGPTPASRTPGEIRPASPVNIFGRLRGDPRRFRSVRSGERVTVERAEVGEG